MMAFIHNCFLFAILYIPGLISASPSQNHFYEGRNSDVETRQLDEIYVAAQKEVGDLVVLWGGDEAKGGDGIIEGWKAQFPKINLNLTVDLSKYADSRVDRNYRKFGNERVDVIVLQTVHDFDHWKRSGRLLPYKPATWEDIYSAFRDPDGTFFGAFISQFGNIIYNNRLINETDVPVSYADFNYPKWKGKLTLTYPNDDDAVLYLFSLIIGKYGWLWLESLAEQDVHWVRGTGTTASLLSAQDSPYMVSFTANLNDSKNIMSKTPVDPHMLWPQTCAAFASSSRPESAKLFLSWLASDQFQQVNAASGDYVVRSNMNSARGIVWDDARTDVTHFWKFMTDRETVEWWRLQIESTLGTAQGLSPLHTDI